MLNNFLDTLVLVKYPLIGLFFSLAMLSLYWLKIFNYFKLKTYTNIQRVHKNEIPRLGGFFIYLFLWVVFFIGLIDDNFFYNLLISSIPFVAISLKEDLFHDTSPKNRLILMVFSCLIFFYLNPIQFPIIDLPYLGKIIALYPINIIFFSFAILTLMNGMNLIDGMNGLFGFSALFQLIILGFFANFYTNYESFNLLVVLALPLIIFLFFNFPLGKIFMGDLGAYLYGFFISLICINFFGKHPEVLSWYAILILFYPCMELLFSFIRKKQNNLLPFDADNKHLHTLLNKKFLKLVNSNLFANSLTTFSLFIFWLTTPLWAIYFININVVTLILLTYIILYVLAYKLISNWS